MQAVRIRTMIVTVSFLGLGLLSACGKESGTSANQSGAMAATENGGSMASGSAMTSGNSMAADGNSMAAGNTMGDSMQASNSMQTDSMKANSH